MLENTREFFQLLVNDAVPFLRNAVIASALGSIPLGMIGCFVVIKRMSYITGAISHSLLAGIGLSLVLKQYGIALAPSQGIFLIAILASLLLAQLRPDKQRMDSSLSLLWSLGMGIGILCINATPGYFDASSYLFGNILLISTTDLYNIAVLASIVTILIILFYRRLLALAFDEEYFRTRSRHFRMYRTLFFLLVGSSIATLTPVVGILLLIALLTLPATACLHVCNTTQGAIIASIPTTCLVCFLGIWISYVFDMPSGTSIVIIAAITYLIAIAIRALNRSA